MTKFGRAYVAIPVFVEVAKAFYEIFRGICVSRLGNLLKSGKISGNTDFYALKLWHFYLINGQENFEGNTFIGLVLMRVFFHIRFCGILAQRSQSIPDLGHVNLPIAAIVKKLEGFVKLWEKSFYVLNTN